MPIEPFQKLAFEFPPIWDKCAYSHRSIDPRQRANGVRRVSVRVTQAQYEQIVERAKSLRLTVAEYVRLRLDVAEVTDTPVN